MEFALKPTPAQNLTQDKKSVFSESQKSLNLLEQSNLWFAARQMGRF